MNPPAQPDSTDVVKIDPANPRQEHFLQFSSTLDESRRLDLRPVYISLGLDPSAFPNKLGGVQNPDQSRFSLPKGVFDKALRGSEQFTDRIWFFRGDSYLRYLEGADREDRVEGPLPIAPNWGDWPVKFSTGIDAALQGTGAYEGKAWFFKGHEYLRYDIINDRVELGIKPIAGNWRGVSGAFAQGIDAAIHGLGSFFGVCWFFKGGQYLRYNLATDTVEGEPRPILGAWGGDTWPAAFADGVDFAFYGTGSNAEKIYFFRGDKYILYNLKTDRVEEGPTPMIKNWRNLEPFMSPPQLFIVEQYALHTFRGEMGRGSMIEGSDIHLSPGAKTEFFIVTKKRETSTESSSTNILESQSQQTADRFSEAVRKDKSDSGSEEKYGYELGASFHGEAGLTLTGGEASADLNVKGASQDVRTAFANTVNKQLEKQAAETRDIHKQRVIKAEAEHVINQETETGFRQTIENTSQSATLNCFLLEVTQEYIIVLSLVDAKLAFHNGNPRDSQVVPTRDMAKLLDQCILQPEARARISATVMDVLKNIVDHSGQTRSLIVQAPGDPALFQVDRTLTSKVEVKDTTGQLLRPIVVPGIVLNVQRPVVLTANALMAPARIS